VDEHGAQGHLNRHGVAARDVPGEHAVRKLEREARVSCIIGIPISGKTDGSAGVPQNSVKKKKRKKKKKKDRRMGGGQKHTYMRRQLPEHRKHLGYSLGNPGILDVRQ
jgi:hypothetical protein